MYIFILTIILSLSINSLTLENLITIPNLGRIKGLVKTFNDTSYVEPYYQYKGIPYGQNPSRFTIAKPTSSWTNIHDGTIEGPVCPQPFGKLQYPGNISENCLVLTVTTPLNPNNLKTLAPVVVFIHGGMYITGTNHINFYDPEKLVQEGIVVVQPQYRLGVLGWLTDGAIIPKNIGLKDVRLALTWVQNHIESFGGDPNKVTLYGESAGSTISSALWQSHRTTNLFQKVFMQSGVVINPWAVQKKPEEAFKFIVQGTRCNYTLEETNEHQVDCLKNLHYMELNFITVVDLIVVDVITAGVLDGVITSIVLEDVLDPDAIVVQNPLEQLENNDFPKDKPLLISGTSEEFYTFAAGLGVLRMQTNSGLVPYGMMADDTDYVGGLIKEHYSGSQSHWPFMSLDVYMKFGSDICFNYPLRRYVGLIQPTMLADIFVMQFSYASEMGRFNDGVNKTGHSDDLIYTWKEEVFTNEDMVGLSYSLETFNKRKQFNRMIGNFIKYGNPTPRKDPLLMNIIWPKMSNPEIFEYLDFDHNLTINNRLKEENYQFWSGLYQRFSRGKVSL